jgi:Cu/Ag efflux protein CusF
LQSHLACGVILYWSLSVIDSIEDCMNRKTLGGIVAGALIAVSPLVSSAADALPASFEGRSVLQADGVVKGVDEARHVVTVVDQQGGVASFNVTDASNLGQIQPGNKVQIRMTRTALVSASHGEQASAPSSPQNTAAEVQTVDHASGVVALKGADGAIFHIQGGDPAKVANLRPGMHVRVVYAAQVSVAVAPAE